jgi:1,4-dihydroxy-2-naphthoate octaprenyltransferase
MDIAWRSSATLRHLRLPFQLTLAPLFLWGAFLAGGRVGVATAVAFVALHLFLYPAATAFNSVYDRDEGPVGGMKAPPPVPEGLLRVSIALAAAGALLAAAAGWGFLFLYGLLGALLFGYSHPVTRWKSSPWASSAVIAVGQGALGFLAGWVAAAPLQPVSEAVLAGSAAAALTALGLYPVTQVYQIEEDRTRGDRTLAVALGPAWALRLGGTCLVAAGALTFWLVARRIGGLDAAIAAAAYCGIVGGQERLARRIRNGLERDAAYREAMRLIALATAGFLLFIAWQAARRLLS